nr:TolC family protein [uncultured Brevundimonas sp.]
MSPPLPRLRSLPPLLLTALLAGCVSYAPQPIDLSGQAGAVEQARPIPVGTVLSESEALALALERSTGVRQARAAWETARAASRSARVSPGWTLNLTTEFSRQADPQHPWLFGGGLDIPVDRGTRRDARVDTSDLAILKGRYDVAEAVWVVRTALHRALIDRGAAEAQLTAALAQRDLLQQRVDAVVRRVSAGEDDRTAFLQARTDLTTATQQVTVARALRAQADAVLAAALHLPVEALDGVRITPDPTPDLPDAMARAQRLDAATARADILKAVVDYDTAEQGVRTAVAAQYPAITLSPGYTWERGVTKLPFSLGLALPPMDLNRAAISEAEARRQEAGRAIEAAQARVFAEADAALASLHAADAELARLMAEDAPLAARALRTAQRSLEAGAGDRTTLLSAEASALAVDLARMEAGRQRALAIADFETATRTTQNPADTAVMARIMADLEGPAR